MNDFLAKSISECCEILDSFRIPLNEAERNKIPGNIPYYGANGVQGYIDKYIFNEDLILIAEDGGNFEAYETRPIAYRISGKSWINNHAHILRALKHYNQDYIFYSLVNKNVINYIVGGTRSKLNQRELKTITISIPQTKSEQTTIAHILSTVDKAIKQTEKLIAKYKRIKTGLMQDLLTKGIDENGNIRSEKTHKFKDSPLGRIPIEWETQTLLDLVHNNKSLIVGGPFGSNLKVSDYQKEGVPLIRLQNIDRNTFVNKDIKYVTNEKAKELEYHSFVKGDIVLAKLGDPVGKTCIVPDDFFKGIVVADVVRVRLNDNEHNKHFFSTQLNVDFVSSQINGEIIGTTRPRVNLNQIRNLILKVPSKSEQDKISFILNKSYENIQNEFQWSVKLTKLKIGLMQDLLTGKVRVPEELIEEINNKLNNEEHE